MGLMKKAAKGTLAAGTLGGSVAAEKAIKAGAAALGARGTNVTEEEAGSGALFVGMSHEAGRNAKVTLYADRIERVKERSRVSLSSARQDTEVTPVKTVTSVEAKKDGVMFTKVDVYAAGHTIEFRFRHDDAQRFKDALMGLILKEDAPAQSGAPEALDPTDQIAKLAALRDSGVLTEDEFQQKKAELLDRM